MDNFVILARNMKELEERTIQFLKIAEMHNLCFKQSKCNFNIEEIPILGVIVGKGWVQIETNKVKAVKEWKTPTKIKEVESFLEFTNFYRWFIKNFSEFLWFIPQHIYFFFLYSCPVCPLITFECDMPGPPYHFEWCFVNLQKYWRYHLLFISNSCNWLLLFRYWLFLPSWWYSEFVIAC